MQEAALSDRNRYVCATGTFPNNATVLATNNKLAHKAYSNIKTKNGNFTFGNTLKPIPISIAGKSAGIGGNVLGVCPADGQCNMYVS